MQDLQQRLVHGQGLRLAYELGGDLPPQGLRKACELPHAPVEGGEALWAVSLEEVAGRFLHLGYKPRDQYS